MVVWWKVEEEGERTALNGTLSADPADCSPGKRIVAKHMCRLATIIASRRQRTMSKKSDIRRY